MRRMYIVVAAIIGIALVIGISRSQNNEADQNKNAAASQENAPGQPVGQTKEEVAAAALAASSYTYTAQSGDSYTKMARKALLAFSEETKAGLTQAQIIFAETNLTNEAKKPFLEIGQKVSVSKDTIKGWADKAKQLTVSQIAAWQVYVANVNFDVSKVGVSR